MARIRTIKPEFWSDDTITECSLSARLLFIGIWNFADDAGNLDRSHKQIKTRIFPLDNINCEPLIQELLTHGLLIEYSVSGQKYLHIPGFAKHQLINRPSKPVVPAYEESLRTHVALTEGSVSTHPVREGKGREGSGREGNTQEALAKIDQTEAELMNGYVAIVSAYPKRAVEHGILDEREYRKRIDGGVPHDELAAGVARYAEFVGAGGVSAPKFVMAIKNFFAEPEREWRKAWEPPKAKTEIITDTNEAAAAEAKLRLFGSGT